LEANDMRIEEKDIKEPILISEMETMKGKVLIDVIDEKRFQDYPEFIFSRKCLVTWRDKEGKLRRAPVFQHPDPPIWLKVALDEKEGEIVDIVNNGYTILLFNQPFQVLLEIIRRLSIKLITK
jgi:hypothetical protein